MFLFYKGVAGSCRFSTTGQKIKIKGHKNVPGTEIELQKALTNIGPISIAVHVSTNFVAYQNGRILLKSIFGVKFSLNSFLLL